MTEDTRQVDPQNPGPTMSLLAVTAAVNGIGMVIDHVINFHDVDDAGRTDLAVTLVRINTFVEGCLALMEADADLMAEVEKAEATLENQIPEDVWEAFKEAVGEETLQKMQEEIGGNGE